jgi:hypothetical protein
MDATPRSEPDPRTVVGPISPPISPLIPGPEAVVELRNGEPVIDLREDKTGPIVGRSPSAALYERRDATQRARFIAVVVIAVLNVFDLITTYAAISVGAHEGNPIVSWAVSSPLIGVAKVLVCGTLIFGAIIASRTRRVVTLPALCAAWAVVGIYSLVVLLNTINLASRV